MEDGFNPVAVKPKPVPVPDEVTDDEGNVVLPPPEPDSEED
jgi:hypothetical protein